MAAIFNDIRKDYISQKQTGKFTKRQSSSTDDRGTTNDLDDSSDDNGSTNGDDPDNKNKGEEEADEQPKTFIANL